MIIAGQQLVIDAKDDSFVRARCRCRNKYALGSCRQMHCRFVTGCKNPGAFINDINAHFAPGKIFRIALSQHLDRARAKINRITGDFHLIGKTPVDTVILNQMRIRLDGT